ncbi:hypothetical protein OG738_25325 [Amycolatopsis sp. NBC_01488]|nr:hypothetical protein [Amycolatopsis sp. NBC_01488]
MESARRTGYRGRIVLVGAEAHLPYDRPPLSKAFPATGWLEGSGLTLHERGVVCDATLCAGPPGVYAAGDRIVGALTVDRPREIMKYRRRIATRASWSEALAFAGAA